MYGSWSALGRSWAVQDATSSSWTGLRRNEIRAFEYTYIDWANKGCFEEKASDGVRKWEWQIGQPKSRKSNRRVAAPEAVLEPLRRLRSRFLGVGRKTHGPPTTSMNSSSADYPPMPACRTSGSTILRHFFASTLILLGHKNPFSNHGLGLAIS